MMKDIASLIRSISEGESFAHAYIVEGPAGSARDGFITKLAEGLGCDMPDFIRMQKSGKLGYRTDDAAEFAGRLAMRPYGRYLMGIIDDADSMSEAVQNKLLKTLEEPAVGTILLLCTSRPRSLLPTVRSRCSHIRLEEYEEVLSDPGDIPGEFMEGAFMILTQRAAFYEFREFLDKNIKTQDDAILLISLAEDKLREAMRSGKAAGYCAERIAAAEKTASDISGGMDKNKALKRLFLSSAWSR